ncbi:kell blood group glycoprotein-like [Arapaima gigas]
MNNHQPVSQSQSVRKPWPSAGQGRLLLFLSSSFVVILLGLGFSLYCAPSDNSTVRAPLPCVSQACLKAAAKLSPSADPFSQPCDDLLFTCGTRERQSGKNIIKREEGPGEQTLLRGKRRKATREADRYTFEEAQPSHSVRRAALLELLREVLESAGSGDSAKQKARWFYSSCMDTQAIEKLGSEPVLKLIQKLGGSMASRKWNHFNFNSALSVLMKEYFTFPFFNVYVGRDANSSDHRRYIQLDQPDIQIPVEWKSNKKNSKEKAQDLRNFLLSQVQLLSLLGISLSSTSMHTGHLIQLSSQLARFTRPLLYRLQQQQLYHRMTVKELQAQAPAIDWLGCLRAVFHPLAVGESDTVLLHNLPYIKHMSQTISAYHRNDKFSNCVGTLYTFMILSLLHTLTPALDSRFTEIRRNLSAALGNAEEVVPRWAHCVLQTETVFGEALGNAVRERVGEREAEDLIQTIYSSLESKLAELNLGDDDHAILNKVRSLTPQFSPNIDVMSEKTLDQRYAKVQITEDYFSNYLQSLSLRQQRRNELFMQASEPDILLITPFVTGSEINFPLGMFVPPLFHPSYPRAVNYGALGTLMAKNILHLLLPEMQMRMKTLQAVSECVWSLFGNMTEGPHGFLLPLTLEQQLTVWVEYTALQIALQGYKNSLLKQPQDTSLSGIYHTHLFLTSFVQINCIFVPYHEQLPFEASFLVAAICMNSDLCPESMTCSLNTHKHFKQKC